MGRAFFSKAAVFWKARIAKNRRVFSAKNGPFAVLGKNTQYLRQFNTIGPIWRADADNIKIFSSCFLQLGSDKTEKNSFQCAGIFGYYGVVDCIRVANGRGAANGKD